MPFFMKTISFAFLFSLTLQPSFAEGKTKFTYEEVTDFAVKQISELSSEPEIYGALDTYGIELSTTRVYKTLRYQQGLNQTFEATISSMSGISALLKNSDSSKAKESMEAMLEGVKVLGAELRLMRDIIEASLDKLEEVEQSFSYSAQVKENLEKELVSIKVRLIEHDLTLAEVMNRLKDFDLDHDHLNRPLYYQKVKVEDYFSDAPKGIQDLQVKSLTDVTKRMKALGFRPKEGDQSLIYYELEDHSGLEHQATASVDFLNRRINAGLRDKALILREIDNSCEKIDECRNFFFKRVDNIKQVMRSVQGLALETEGVMTRAYLAKYGELERSLLHLRLKEEMMKMMKVALTASKDLFHP